ncbi:MAG: osmosensitive channel signal transduction histidine kinase [Ilumatobacteraceae bacterium]|nr:osmosensitive channel signal transduction histidine kinase [Ilumatobacteraceae bacterium]
MSAANAPGRGTLRVYLGAAPGVGKTYAMLEEGRRRAARGTNVVVGIVETHGRAAIHGLLADMTVIPPRSVLLAGISVPEMHLDDVLAARPDVVLVDDMAHHLAPGEHRWHEVGVLLDAGIDVVTTVGVENLESMNDVIATITGSTPTETIPDSFVRAADQIELVDMSPEALRRRLAHGNVYPPERIDAALADYFRPGTLGALRQLALLWVADRVDERLQDYVATHGIAQPWEIRERVVIALAGFGGGHVVRRAARIAGRVRGELVGVHVVTDRGEPGPDLELQRRLVTELGGVYREVVGDDVAQALAGFARVEQATQLVLGANRRAPGSRRGKGTIANALVDELGHIDVHVIGTDAPSSRPNFSLPHVPHLRRAVPVKPRLRASAWVLCLVGLPLLTFVLTTLRRHVSLGSALLLDLCVVLGVATLGGLLPGLFASAFAFALTNWFLTEPLHTLTVNDAQNVVALAVFVAVTVVVGIIVDRSAGRSREAARARAEAGALARSAATLVGEHDPLPELLEQLRATFGLEAAAVLERQTAPAGAGGAAKVSWWPTVLVGSRELLDPTDGTSVDLAEDGSVRLVVSTEALGPDQLEVLRAFADQLSVALQGRKLRADAANAEVLAEANALRTALLQAVSHDLRTPLASIKASASGLLQTDVEFSDEDRTALLVNIDNASDRLDGMVRDLLDMSRLQAGVVGRATGHVALEEVVAAALSTVPASIGRVIVSVSESLPLVHADSGLLSRALANLISNAVAWSPADADVRVDAGLVGNFVDVRIVDRGPGIPVAERDRMFVPFQRLGDRSNDAGVGLGMAIARGFIDAIGAHLEAEDTPGGGLTMSIRLRAVLDSAPDPFAAAEP